MVVPDHGFTLLMYTGLPKKTLDMQGASTKNFYHTYQILAIKGVGNQ